MPVQHSTVLCAKGFIQQLCEKPDTASRLELNNVPGKRPKGNRCQQPYRSVWESCSRCQTDVYSPSASPGADQSESTGTGHRTWWSNTRSVVQTWAGKGCLPRRTSPPPCNPKQSILFPQVSDRRVTSDNFFSGPSRLTGWKLKMCSGHRHVWGSNSHKKVSTEHTLPQTPLKLC